LAFLTSKWLHELTNHLVTLIEEIRQYLEPLFTQEMRFL
jgi:hypothetical protein